MLRAAIALHATSKEETRMTSITTRDAAQVPR